MFQIYGVFAEFERSIIREWINAGLARARSNGKRLGRPPVSDGVVERVRSRLAEGTGIRETAGLEGVGVSVVQRVNGEFSHDARSARI